MFSKHLQKPVTRALPTHGRDQTSDKAQTIASGISGHGEFVRTDFDCCHLASAHADMHRTECDDPWRRHDPCRGRVHYCCILLQLTKERKQLPKVC